MATGSSSMRRAQKTSASRLGASSHWASSTTTSTGESAATTPSRLSAAAYAAKRSGAAGGPSARAARSAARWGAGTAGRRSSTGRSRSASAANGRPASVSWQRVRSTRKPSARPMPSSTSAVLPMPGGPRRTSARPRPRRDSSSAAAMRAISAERPTSATVRSSASRRAASMPSARRCQPRTTEVWRSRITSARAAGRLVTMPLTSQAIRRRISSSSSTVQAKTPWPWRCMRSTTPSLTMSNGTPTPVADALAARVAHGDAGQRGGRVDQVDDRALGRELVEPLPDLGQEGDVGDAALGAGLAHLGDGVVDDVRLLEVDVHPHPAGREPQHVGQRRDALAVAGVELAPPGRRSWRAARPSRRWSGRPSRRASAAGRRRRCAARRTRPRRRAARSRARTPGACSPAARPTRPGEPRSRPAGSSPWRSSYASPPT